MDIVEATVAFLVEPIALQLGYLTNYKSICQYLQSEVEKLSFAQERLQYSVEVALRKGDKILAEVQDWRAEVDKVIREAKDCSNNENLAKMECVPGSSYSPILRYKLGKKARKLVEKVEELLKASMFSRISYHESPEEAYIISTQDYEAFESRTATVNVILVEIRNSTTNAIGVYGIGGVGKTTLVKEVCRQVKKEKLFDHVVLVFDVNKYPDLVMLQKQISESLGIKIVEETLSRRADRIRNALKDKDVLVVFDDVWASIDLKAVGIPNAVKCKILWTSRRRIVLDSDNIRTQKEFQLHFLEDEETWRLFERTAGDVIKDPTIRDVAVRVAGKCGGLPSLVISVASSLRMRSTTHVWEHSLTQLEPFVRNRLTEIAYSAFEWSYEKLDEKELKPLFLLCGRTAGNDYISVEDLLTYSLGLGWFKNISIEEARKTLFSLVEKLKEYCLLLDGNNNLVRIHSFLRSFAVSVASKDEHLLSRAHGDELESRNDQIEVNDGPSAPVRKSKDKGKGKIHSEMERLRQEQEAHNAAMNAMLVETQNQLAQSQAAMQQYEAAMQQYHLDLAAAQAASSQRLMEYIRDVSLARAQGIPPPPMPDVTPVVVPLPVRPTLGHPSPSTGQQQNNDSGDDDMVDLGLDD